MNIEEIKNDVIYTESSKRLFELMIILTEEDTVLRINLIKQEDISIKTEIKGKIALVSTLQSIIDKRLQEVNNTEREKDRKELLVNRQFRIAAESILKRETFEKLKELSNLNYLEFKNLKSLLKQNKIE